VFVELRRPSPDVPDRLGGLEGVTDVQVRGEGQYEVACGVGLDRREEIARAAVQKDWGLVELRPVGMSLEEIFLRLTTHEQEEEAEEAA
jgi:ABC-2 type transport system ATP-binding protein